MKGEYTGSRGRGRGRGGRADGRKSQDMGGIKSVASTGGRGLGTNRSSSNGNRGKAEQARVIRGGKSGRGEGRGRGGGKMRKGAPFPKEKAKQDASQGDRSSSGQDRKRKFPSSSYSAGRGRSNGRGGSGGRGGGRGGGGRGGDRKGRGGGHEGDDTEGLTMPANKKRRLKLERQQHRPEFDTVLRSKKIWNRLRERKVPAEEISRLAEELRGLIKGKVLNIAMKHDASRVVQTAIQFADEEARLSILSEIEGSLVELSRLTYSHFIVLRLFKETKRSEEIRKRVAKAFRGHIVRLATHSIGARVIQTALDSLPNSYTALIKAEFYGREFALFDDGDQPHSLKGVLEARPDRRNMVMKHVYGVIGRLVAKSLMQFEFAHDLLWEYMELATPLEMQDLVPQLLESYMVLLSTRAGSMAGAMCAAHGGAKERKRLMRALKGYVASSLMHRDAYISVMRLVESVDDTILCQKTILAELLKPLEGSKAMVNGVPSPGQGTSAEGWVPRGNTKPRGGKQESGSENPRKGDGEGEGDEQGDRRDHPEGEKDGGEAEEEEEDEGSEEEDGDGDGDGEVGEKAEEEDEEDEEEEEEEDENEEGNEDEEGKEDDKQGDEREAEGGPEPEEQHADEEEGRGAEPPALLAVIMHRNGCKLLLRLLAPERTGYLHPEELELLKPTLVPAAARARATSNNAETQEGGDGGPALVPSSRKDPATQRRELLAFLREPLREVCAAHADELMRSKFAGSLVLLEAMQAIGNPGLVQAVVNAACSVSLGKQPKMHEDPAGHLFMKQLLTREGEGQGKDEEESHAGGSAATPPPSCFADALVERLGPSLLDWVESNRGAFVVSALEQVPSAKDAVGKVLRAKAGREKVMELASKEGSRNTGAKVLAQQLGFGDFGVKGASADCPMERTGEAKGDSKSSRGVVKEGKEKS